MNVNEHLHRGTLMNARARRTPWFEIVRAIRDLQSQALNDQHGRPWIAYAQEVSGYNYVQIREMIRTYDTVEWLAARLKTPAQDIFVVFPKHSIELISRIRKIDEDSAMNVYLRIKKENLTVTSLRKIYDDIKNDKKSTKSDVSVGKTLSTEFEKNCFSLIEKSKEDFYIYFDKDVGGQKPTSCKIVPFPGRPEFISPSFIVVIIYPDNRQLIAAVDCAFTSIENENRTARRLKTAYFDSLYFNMFYLMIPSWSRLELIENIRSRLQIRNVGVISVNTEEGSFYRDKSQILDISESPSKILKDYPRLIKVAQENGKELAPSLHPHLEEDLSNFLP